MMIDQATIALVTGAFVAGTTLPMVGGTLALRWLVRSEAAAHARQMQDEAASRAMTEAAIEQLKQQEQRTKIAEARLALWQLQGFVGVELEAMEFSR
jgi:hypothetical protein